MKAVVLKKPKTLALMDVPDFALPDQNHVLIRVKACGICGSDLRYWAGDNPWALHTLGRHIDNPPNMILGHEFAGEVVAVRAKKYEHLLGKKVGVQSYRVCGKCRFCRSGRENLCREMIHIGHAQGWGKMNFYPGAYAEYCPAWADLLHPLDDHLSYSEAAMADILCVAVHVCGRTAIYDGAGIFCIGGGPAGLGIAQVAKSKGAGKVFITDPSPIARDVISRFPDFTVIDPQVQDPGRVIRDSLGDEKCAAIFDSVGSRQTLQLALPLLEESGTYVNLAVHKTNFSFDASLIGSERTLTTSSNAHYSDLVQAYELLNKGIIDVKPWITHRLPLEKYAEAFDLLLKDPKQAYKVVFQPWSA